MSHKLHPFGSRRLAPTEDGDTEPTVLTPEMRVQLEDNLKRIELITRIVSEMTRAALDTNIMSERRDGQIDQLKDLVKGMTAKDIAETAVSCDWFRHAILAAQGFCEVMVMQRLTGKDEEPPVGGFNL